MTLRLGAIADDFTGATDLAVTLAKQGMAVTQIFGVPDRADLVRGADAIVIALKSRSIAPERAVAQSLAAHDWLVAQGAGQIVFKYCSTFDSTDAGNIGPVADALLAASGSEIAYVCPAFPANGRTVYMGHLFVGSQLLSDSPMKDHPVTPMRDSNLVRLMARQSEHSVGLVPLEIVRNGAAAIETATQALARAGHRYAVVDATSEADLHAIGRAAASHALVTGGSGVALGLPAGLGFDISAQGAASWPRIAGRSVVLAGSCSAATRAQIAHVAQRWPTAKVAVEEIAQGRDVVGDLTDWAVLQPSETPVLIYASAAPEEVRAIQDRFGARASGEMIETAMGGLAQRLVQSGFARLVVAGGETSGAVVQALDLRALRICGEIAPGVPWTQSTGETPLALALKSGNFGAVDFFEHAFAVLA